MTALDHSAFNVMANLYSTTTVTSLGLAYVEIDHQVTRFGINNITLGWKTIPYRSDCNYSRILSSSPCQQNNNILDITTLDTRITLSSENVYISDSDELADINISTFSDQSAMECPVLPETIRINGKYTPFWQPLSLVTKHIQ